MKQRRSTLAVALLAALALVAAACGSDASSSDGAAAGDAVFTIGAIPDQDPDVLQRTYGDLSTYLTEALGVTVEYVPVTDYAASVSAFRTGDLDAVWFGGLTGAQARAQVDGAQAVAQRDIDPKFTSVFIVADDSDIETIADVAGLSVIGGRTVTFGSDTSTSGRLMPQYFLDQAGVTFADFDGEPGFSGSHDATIALVSAGTYEVGALNSSVWFSRVEEGAPETDNVRMIFETPTYYDYSWVVQPTLDETFGDGFSDKFVAALEALSADDPAQAAILEAFGAASFIPTSNDNYAQIEAIGESAGLLLPAE